ncbi:hypothetical protein L195_g051205, partial [Trifolium pratense]
MWRKRIVVSNAANSDNDGLESSARCSCYIRVHVYDMYIVVNRKMEFGFANVICLL